jgi:hypothetical protein
VVWVLAHWVSQLACFPFLQSVSWQEGQAIVGHENSNLVLCAWVQGISCRLDPNGFGVYLRTVREISKEKMIHIKEIKNGTNTKKI